MTSNLHEQEEYDTIIRILTHSTCNVTCNICHRVLSEHCFIGVLRSYLNCGLCGRQYIKEPDLNYMYHIMTTYTCCAPNINCIDCAWKRSGKCIKESVMSTCGSLLRN